MKFKPQCLIIGFFLAVFFIPSIGMSCTNPPVKNIYSGNYYTTLQAAYDDAWDGDIILVQGNIFIEDYYFDLSKVIYFEFGYDCEFMVTAGSVTLDGVMYITNGAVFLLSDVTLAGDMWIEAGEVFYTKDLTLDGEMYITNGAVFLLSD